jgi:hypothetical protein
MTSMLYVRGLGPYIVRHPSTLVPLSRAAWKLRRRGWWHQVPFLPLPDEAYWTFRQVTAVGSAGATLQPKDAVAAAQWSVRQGVGR